MYKVFLKTEINDPKGFIDLEKKFKRILQDLDLQDGSNSISVELIEYGDSYELRDSKKKAEYDEMIERKYHEQNSKTDGIQSSES